ncbi:MAG: helix-turn-helix domain-containing protein [Alphaproteobacteria bacterium]|nr:helix-turn-helix domain-containing protein [Alphaproteobacteria bacterium]
MSQGLRTLQPHDLAAELELELFPRLSELLRSRAPGHCMRLTDLDRDLMVRLCGRLRAEIPDAQVVILGNGHSTTPPTLTVSSTKLVELRNPLQDGALRPPLLVFIPNDLRAAAEDSFGVATFEDVPVGDVYQTLRRRLLEEIPTAVRGAIAESLRRLEGEDPWKFADPLSVVRFLLTAKLNGSDSEAVGAALFELALVPDFELLNDPTRAPARVARNRECVKRLTWSSRSERGRVLDLGLKKGAFVAQLGEFLAESGVEDPRDWTRRIVLDRACWKFAFHRWEFEEGGEEQDAVFIGDVVVDLPTVGEDPTDPKLQELKADEKILVVGQGGLRKFNVSFRVDPHPSRVEGLAKFVAQVISKDTGPVGLVRSKNVWSTSRTTATIGFSGLNKIEWEEGWHFVRMLAQTEDGDLIPLVDEHGNPLPWAVDDDDATVDRPNESDLFYVVTDLPDPPAPPQRAVQRDESLEHARLRLQFSAVVDGRDAASIAPVTSAWAERRRGRAVGTEMLEVQFGRDGTVHIPVSRTLKSIEQAILDPRLAMALARYQVVSAYVATDLHRGQRRAFLEHLAKRAWTGPDNEPMRVTAETIRVWVRRYRRGGLDALFDKERPSPGVQVLSPELLEIACALKRQVPERTIDTLIRIMEDLGHVEPGVVRRSTLHRALQAVGLSRRPPTQASTEDLDRWEAAAPQRSVAERHAHGPVAS